MSANVETMFSVREKPWHYEMTKDVTRIIQEAPTSADALVAAGLDWEVVPTQISLLGQDKAIPNAVANVRSSDGKVLGIVTDRYTIVQNREAFQFTDNLIGGDVRYETAGSLKGGKLVWMLAKLPSERILGDEVEPYICFTNTHDGSGAVKVIMTPVRVVCNNTLNLALGEAKRSWSTKHVGSIEGRIHQAEETLELAHSYMDCLKGKAERLANIKFDEDAVKKMLDTLYPVGEDASNREKANNEASRQSFIVAYNMADIAQFYGTAWGVINAAADVVGHSAPQRASSNWEQHNFERILSGRTLLDQVSAMVKG